MLRILERELMDDPSQSLAYAKADFSSSDRFYVESLIRDRSGSLARVVDFGCGPCNVMLRLASAAAGVHITGVDGSEAMISLAREAVAAAGLEHRIVPLQGYIPGLALPEQSFDAILSKDFLHHLPDPSVLWSEARRLGRPGAAIHVMDLIRPDTPEAARDIVESVARNEAPVLKEDFFNSLCAAFTVAEVDDQLRLSGLRLRVEQVSERHMLVKGSLG